MGTGPDGTSGRTIPPRPVALGPTDPARRQAGGSGLNGVRGAPVAGTHPAAHPIHSGQCPNAVRAAAPRAGWNTGAVQVRFVGCGDAFGSGGRWQTCISVTTDGQRMLVDCGSTSLAALRSQGIDPGSVAAVAVTHLHGDHFGGLPLLILDGQFGRRTGPLRVLGPAGIAARLEQAMEVLFPGSSRVERRFPVEVEELAPNGPATRVGGLTVRAWPVVHECGAPPLALRVEDGRSSFAYSGDTEWTPALVDAARGSDLFAVEAYTYEKPIRYHLAYRTLRPHLDEIGAGRTVLTHMSADMLSRLADADLPAAYDGMTVEL
jgi:ribonuclease BN (tRNA processing enzyme)